MIVGALGAFCEAGTADDVDRFFTTHKVPDAERTLKQALENIRSCARFAQTQRPKLTQWIRLNRDRATSTLASEPQSRSRSLGRMRRRPSLVRR